MSSLAAVGFLEFVGQTGERGEADAAALLAGADRERGGQHRLAGAGLADEDHALAVVDPTALGERGDRGLGDVGVVGEAEVLQALDDRELGVQQPAAFAALGALGDLGLQQRGEVGDRGLLLARGFLGERAEASSDGRQVQLGGVRVDQRLERLDASPGRSSRGPASRAAGRSRPVVGSGRSICLQVPRQVVEAGDRCSLGPASEDADGAAVVGAGGERAADGEFDLRGAVLAAEEQDVDHLAGGFRGPVALADARPELVEAAGPVAALAVLVQRERAGQRAGLARPAARGSDPAGRETPKRPVSRSWRATTSPSQQTTISRAPILASSRRPTRPTGTE